MKTNTVQNVPTTKTHLDENCTVLHNLYATNTTASNATLSLQINESYFIKDLVIPPGVTISLLDSELYGSLRYMYIQAGTANAIDVVYNAE
jgi:hypothetical protein